MTCCPAAAADPEMSAPSTRARRPTGIFFGAQTWCIVLLLLDAGRSTRSPVKSAERAVKYVGLRHREHPCGDAPTARLAESRREPYELADTYRSGLCGTPLRNANRNE